MPEDVKKLSLEIPEKMHKNLKVVAVERDCTMRNYIIQHVQNALERDIKRIYKERRDRHNNTDTD